MKSTLAKISGNLEYPKIFDQRDKYDRWSVSVVLEGDQVKNARNLGLKINQKDDRYDGKAYITLKSNFQPQVFDKNGDEYSGAKYLTTGTEGVVTVTQKPYDNKYGKGVSTFMKDVTLTKVVEWVPPEGDLEASQESEF
jgi:hypothetical protein